MIPATFASSLSADERLGEVAVSWPWASCAPDCGIPDRGDHRPGGPDRCPDVEAPYSASGDGAGAGVPLAELIDSGRYRSVTELAQALDVDLLAPDIVEAIVRGDEPSGLSLEGLVKGVPVVWEEQRKRFKSSVNGFPVQAAGVAMVNPIGIGVLSRSPSPEAGES